jgi:hypothetical protein
LIDDGFVFAFLFFGVTVGVESALFGCEWLEFGFVVGGAGPFD